MNTLGSFSNIDFSFEQARRSILLAVLMNHNANRVSRPSLAFTPRCLGVDTWNRVLNRMSDCRLQNQYLAAENHRPSSPNTTRVSITQRTLLTVFSVLSFFMCVTGARLPVRWCQAQWTRCTQLLTSISLLMATEV